MLAHVVGRAARLALLRDEMSGTEHDHVTILVVEDDRSAREFTLKTLRDAGFECCAVEGVQEAQTAISRETYDLLLTDLRLADGTGTDLLRWVARNHRFIPVMLMTAYPTVGSAVEAMRLDAVDYLIKPCDDLAGSVLAALKRIRARQLDRQNLVQWANSLRDLADRIDVRADREREFVEEDETLWGTLSVREREVAERFIAGTPVRSIAAELQISDNTVRNHLKAIYRKFDVSSQTELMRRVFTRHRTQ